jgi:hypothetical protein
MGYLYIDEAGEERDSSLDDPEEPQGQGRICPDCQSKFWTGYRRKGKIVCCDCDRKYDRERRRSAYELGFKVGAGQKKILTPEEKTLKGVYPLAFKDGVGEGERAYQMKEV